jgi:hypothetical protein
MDSGFLVGSSLALGNLRPAKTPATKVATILEKSPPSSVNSTGSVMNYWSRWYCSPPTKMKLIRQAQKAMHGVERNPRSVENLVFIMF